MPDRDPWGTGDSDDVASHADRDFTAGRSAGRGTNFAAAVGLRTAENRAFDFWVGRWDVYRTDTDALVAHSLVELMYEGCAIRENWMPHGRAGGGSLSAWDPAARRWRQTWVDSANTLASFEGGIADGAMVLTGRWLGYGGPGTEVMARMTYRRLDDGPVSQRVEVSADGGRSWSLAGAFLYRPAPRHSTLDR